MHSNLGDQAVGAKVNGRVVPLRTEIEQGDQVSILRSKAQQPQANWLNFAITGKARARDPPPHPQQGTHRDDRAGAQAL